MATVDLDAKSFAETVKSNDRVIIDFWADWCQPCKRFGPTFTKASNEEKYGDVVFAKVDTETNQQLAGELGIQSIPTVMMFHKGNLVFNQPGLLDSAQLNGVLDQLVDYTGEEAAAE